MQPIVAQSTPKNYREGMTAEFVMNGKRNYSERAVFENGSFWANIPVDITENDLRFMVRFTSDGETTTQYLDTPSNLINSYLMDVGAENKLQFLNDKEGLLIQGEVITIFSPRYDDLHMAAKLINYPVSGEVIVEKDGKVIIQNKIDLDIDLKDGQYSDCHTYTPINETIKDYKTGDEIRVISRMTDNFGNVRETEVCIYNGF